MHLRISPMTLHTDLHVPFVREVVKQLHKKCHQRLHNHSKLLISELSSSFLPGNTTKRLRRMLPWNFLVGE